MAPILDDQRHHYCASEPKSDIPITACWQPDYLRTPGGGDDEALLLW